MIWRDGDLVDAEPRVRPGDPVAGVFTTVGGDHGRPLLWPRHRARLTASVTALDGPTDLALPAEGDLVHLLRHHPGPARLRVTAAADAVHGWSVEASAAAAGEVGPDLRPADLVVSPWSCPPLAGHKVLARAAWDSARERAREHGADDALLIDTEGAVLETAVASVLARFADTVVAPPVGRHSLPGVLRAWLLDHLGGLGLEVRVRPLPLAELLTADEVWVSNAVIGARRVGSVAGRRWSTWPAHQHLGELAVPAPGWA